MKANRLCKKGELPGAAMGDRVLLLPDSPLEETEYKIHIPDIGKVRPCTGILLAAGLSAMDRLYDQGTNIGDSVIWGQYAGVIWEWDHIQEEGKPDCEHQWARTKSPRDRVSAAVCERCPAVRWTECVILANVDDIQASVDLGGRIQTGEMEMFRGVTTDGRTQHVIRRKGE